MGSFVFKWPHPEANDVHVTGTFDDWGKSVQLNKVGDTWEKDVELPNADDKILYKFVVNGQWIIDPEAPQEDDGHGNINNVLHPGRIKTKGSAAPEGLTTSSAAPGSTTAAMAGSVPSESKREATEVTPASGSHLNDTNTSAPGAFPETPANEKESYGVSPLPPTEGAGNPVNVPAGEKIPPLSQTTKNSIYSAVTMSQQAYEQGGTNIPYIGGALAALGFGGTAAKKENLIPESSLPMGENADKSLHASPFISSSGANTTTADMAGKVPLEERQSATEVDAAVPEKVKESIAEVHAAPEATTSAEAVREKSAVERELLNKVPENDATGEHAPEIAAGGVAAGAIGAGAAAATTSSASGVPDQVKESIAQADAEPEAATSPEAVREKSTMEQELLRKVPENQATGEHAPEIAAGAVAAGAAGAGIAAAASSPVSAVPEKVQASIAEAHAEPEATASAEAVNEKSAVEQELLRKVPEQDEAGEPAPTLAAATTSTAPASTTETSTGAATSTAPATTTETSIGAAPGQSAASAAAVADGADGAAEPMDPARTSVVPNEKTDGDNTEYAPPHAASVAPGVSASAAAAFSDGTEDPTLLEEPAVQMGITNDAETTRAATTTIEPAVTQGLTTSDAPKATTPSGAAPESRKETATKTPTAATASTTSTPQKSAVTTTPAAVPTTSATSTPQKPATTTPSSTPASSSSATKDKKKKNRVSSFFKKIFD